MNVMQKGGTGAAMLPGSAVNMKSVLPYIAFLALAVLLAMLANNVTANDGAEFADAATQFETWVGGNLGKLAAFAALAVGSVVAAVKKDWSWFFGAIVLSIGVGVVTSVVNASFTAVI